MILLLEVVVITWIAVIVVGGAMIMLASRLGLLPGLSIPALQRPGARRDRTALTRVAALNKVYVFTGTVIIGTSYVVTRIEEKPETSDRERPQFQRAIFRLDASAKQADTVSAATAVR